MNAKFQVNEIVINGMTFPASYEIMPDRVRIRADVKSGPACGVYAIDVMEGEMAYSDALRAARGGAGEAEPVRAEDPAEPVQAEEPAEPEKPAEPEQPAEPKKAKKARRSTKAKKAAEPAPEADSVQDAEPEQAAQTVQAEEPAQPVQAEQPAPEAQPEQPAQPRTVPEKTFLNESIKGAGWTIVFDSGAQRTRVIVTEQAREATAPIIEKAGFFWSPNMQSYNKKLTHKAHRAALALADQLRAALAC